MGTGTTVELEKVTMLVQIDGKTRQVVLSQHKLRILANMAASLSETGNLTMGPVIESVVFNVT